MLDMIRIIRSMYDCVNVTTTTTTTTTTFIATVIHITTAI